MVIVAGVNAGSERLRRRLAWALPVLVAGAVAAGVAVSTAATSTASQPLSPRTAKQLLVAVQQTTAVTLSGTVHESARLGLPSLPGDRSSTTWSWQSFITGSHTARVWADGPDKQRVALIGELAEADVVHNGSDVWTYTSATNTVTHTVLRRGTQQATPPGAADLTPSAAAARLLKAVSPSTSVTVDAGRTVAGRSAYTLVLRPRDRRSTVRKVTIAIDAAKHIPLQVQVFGASSKPAFETGFSKISFGRPAGAIFNFRKPAGATVSTDPLGTHDRRGMRGMREHRPAIRSAGPAQRAPRVIGSGWTSVVELSGGVNSIGGGLLDQLTSAVGSTGERLLHTALINAVLLPDGRVFVGAVQPAFLEHVAATAR